MIRHLFIFLFLVSTLLIQAKERVEFTEKNHTTPVITEIEKTKERDDNKKNSLIQPKLASIKVSGVDSELQKNIELHMPVSIPTCDADRAEIKQFFLTVKKHLRKASRSLGYYDANFRSGGSIIDNCWKLRLKIKQGKPTRITSQTINIIGEGKNDILFKKILAKLPYKNGDIFNHQKYTDFKTLLSEATEALGYFDAKFEQHSIRVNPLVHQASVNLVLNTHKRYRYGKVTVDQKILSENTMSKFLILKTGNAYQTEELIKQQQLLQQSGYYKLIKVEALRDQVNNYSVPIHITLSSKKRNAIKYRIGYGSDTKVRVSAELNRRWTSSKGKQFKAKVQAAQNLSGISLQLASPRENPEDDILVYNIDWVHDKNEDITSQNIKMGGKYIRKLPSAWIQSATAELLLDKTTVDREPSNRSNLLLFGVGLDKTQADNLLYPNNGWRFNLHAKGGLKGLISDQSILQLTTSVKRIITIGNVRLFGRAKLGTTKVNDFQSLPKSLRFFAGGGGSVRGYNFESLGDKNSANQIIGGKHLVELNLEYQYPINDEWSAAAFIDAGNAFNDINSPKLNIGVGFGVRWRSPIGPVRIDIGFPKDDISSPHLHLNIGSDL